MLQRRLAINKRSLPVDNNDKIKYVVNTSIEAVLPDKAVKEALASLELKGNIHIIAIGKAA